MFGKLLLKLGNEYLKVGNPFVNRRDLLDFVPLSRGGDMTELNGTGQSVELCLHYNNGIELEKTEVCDVVLGEPFSSKMRVNQSNAAKSCASRSGSL